MLELTLILIVLGVIVAVLYHIQAAQVVGYGLIFLIGIGISLVALPFVALVVGICIIGIITGAVIQAFTKKQ